MKKSYNVQIRHHNGQHFIEVLCGLIFLIPVFLFCYDVAFMYTATSLSDGIARDAARAAAAVVPTVTTVGRKTLSTSAPNNSRATAVIAVAKSKLGGCMRNVVIDPVNSAINIPAGGVPDAFLGGQWRGTVTVRVRTSYVLPVPLQGITPPTMTHEAEAQFPLTVSSPGTVRNPGIIK